MQTTVMNSASRRGENPSATEGAEGTGLRLGSMANECNPLAEEYKLERCS
jgi:hypothetical protein